MLDSAPRLDTLSPSLPAPSTQADVTLYTVAHNRDQQYFVYRPTRLQSDSRVLVSVHGISRNAWAHATYLAHQAEAHNVLVIAPLFTATRCAGYQRIGRPKKGERADYAFNEILDDAGRRTGTDTSRVYLFGYSGGAQFSHRYAMAYPEKVAALSVASAGWYTFPDVTQRYPFGMKRSKSLPDLRFDLDRFLGLPINVFVGQLDNQRDDGLNSSPRIDQQQGAGVV